MQVLFYLFENEVPEIQEGTVKIVAVSREANPPSRAVGPRTKVAVDSIEIKLILWALALELGVQEFNK